MNNTSQTRFVPDFDPGATQFFIVLQTVIIVFALVGNTVILVMFMNYRKLRTKTNYFIISLSCCDIVNAVFVIPFELYGLLAGEKWKLGLILCEFNTTMRFLVLASSNMTLFAVSVYKYIVIKYPYSGPRMQSRRVLGVILLLWGYTLLWSSLPVIGWNDKPSYMKPTDECYIFLSKEWFFFFYTCNFVIPTIAMFIIYFLIFLIARKHMMIINARNRTCRPTAEDKHKKDSFKAACTLAKIIIVYLICWVPFITLMFIYMICNEFCPEFNRHLNRYVHASLMTLQNINTAINPVLFTIWCPDFRKVIRGWVSKNDPCTANTTGLKLLEETGGAPSRVQTTQT